MGEKITYTLLVSNAGPSISENVTVSDALPEGLENAEISTDGGNTFTPFGGVYDVGNLNAGKVVSILIRAVVSSLAAGSLTNTAVVSSDTPDPVPDNNTSTQVTP